MKNLQKGFAIPLIIAIIAILVLGSGALVYARNTGMIDIFLSPEQKEQREIQKLTKLFPDNLGDYELQIKNTYKVQVRNECNRIEDHPATKDITPSGQACGKTLVAEYRQSGSNKIVFVHAVIFNQGKDLYLEALKNSGTPELLGNYPVKRIERHELVWYPASTFDVVITQEGTWRSETDGESMNYSLPATGNNPVTLYFLEKYLPMNPVLTVNKK